MRGLAGLMRWERDRTYASDDDPGSECAVDCRKVGLKPIGLGIHCCVEWSRIFTFRASRLVWCDEAVSQIRLRVKLDVVGHAMVPTVPKVACATAGLGRHAEMVDVTGEVCLTRHADVNSVGCVCQLVGSTTVVAWRHKS